MVWALCGQVAAHRCAQLLRRRALHTAVAAQRRPPPAVHGHLLCTQGAFNESPANSPHRLNRFIPPGCFRAPAKAAGSVGTTLRKAGHRRTAWSTCVRRETSICIVQHVPGRLDLVIRRDIRHPSDRAGTRRGELVGSCYTDWLTGSSLGSTLPHTQEVCCLAMAGCTKTPIHMPTKRITALA